MSTELYFMEKAIELGGLGMNFTSPNPRVGCVIVKEGRIIGRGYHKEYGMEHAEIEAINSASEDLKGSTAYVTLEPCSHQGKTPPCVNKIVKEGISKVVIGVKDPNPQVKGIEYLVDNGVKVKVGVLEKEARELIKDYLKYNISGRPFVTVKAALSWDGKIATMTGDSKWITSGESRNYAMRLRGENDAILVGVKTVNSDNPKLTYRLKEPAAKDPLRLIIDPKLTVNMKSDILRENTVLFTLASPDRQKKNEIRKTGAEIVEIEGKNGYISPEKIIEYLYERNIMSLLIEGGGVTIGNFLFNKLVDRVIFIYGAILIGGKDAPTVSDAGGVENLSDSLKLHNIKRFNIGDDFVMQGDII